jgi:hypothetical protein
MSSSDAATAVESFPLEARVILHGLVKAPALNGKRGVVKSSLNPAGRYTVLVEDDDKTVSLKPANLHYQPRTVESLSIQELKLLLKSSGKQVSDAEMTGMDKSALQNMVSELLALVGKENDNDIAALLAKAQAPTPPAAAASSAPAVDPSQAAEQLRNMDPDQLRQQARMMRAMDASTLRRMNPQLANMSDAQIHAAADQMERMAANPTMRKMAADQINNMSRAEISRMQQQQQQATLQTNNGNATMRPAVAAASTAATPPATITPTQQQADQAARMMASMTPEQMKQQAEALRTMDPTVVRQMNPQLAHMTDDQIKQAATQFEMMASNPDMMKMAMQQMKNMTPEQLEAVQNGTAAAGGMPQATPDMSQMMGGGGGDPANMLANMDKAQLKTMLESVKDNPDMLKQFSAMTGASEAQLKQGLDSFSGMSDTKMDAALKMMQSVQKAKNTWITVDAKAGGHLSKIMISLAAACVGMIVWYFFFRTASGAAAAASMAGGGDIPILASKSATDAAYVEEDEFGGEF